MGKIENDFELSIQLSNVIQNNISVVDSKTINKEDEIIKNRSDILEEQAAL